MRETLRESDSYGNGMAGLPAYDRETDQIIRRQFALLGYGAYGGAALSTTIPDPTVVSYGESDTANDISAMGNTVSQWGSVIGSLVSEVSPNPQPSYVVTTAQPNGPVAAGMSSGSMLLILAVVVVAVILIAKE